MMKAIIFDCDGTLVDSEVLGNEVFVEAIAEHGVTMPVSEALAAFRGRKLAECIREVEERWGCVLPPDFIPQFRARQAAAFRLRLRAVDGALELVSSLRQKFCVASSGPREKIELSLSLTGLLPYFESAIFSSYEIDSWKPAPEIFLHAARTMGVAPSSCVVIEDSLPGLQAGVAAGMEVVAFQPDVIDFEIPNGVTVIKHLSQLKSRL
ncbi:MAG TPA: HAD-IA family hydrolase [Polyangiaceae bacterium]|nr:HAD-IA family hydrolase [Polyangiaceae bacterium]